MATFPQFTERTPSDGDHVVGYNNTSAGGEGRYTFLNIYSYILNKLSFGTASTRDTGTAADEIPLNSEIGSTIQAYNIGLASIAGLGVVTDKMLYTTGINTYALADITAFGRSILDDADAAAARTTLGLVIGTNVQAQNALLTDISGLTVNQGDILYYNGSNIVKLSPGTSGQFLKTLGAGANPAWGSPSSTTGQSVISDIFGSVTLTQYAAETYTFSITTSTVDLWATPSAGDVISFINYSGGSNTIDGNGNDIRSDDVTAASTLVILNNTKVDLIFDGSEWLIKN